MNHNQSRKQNRTISKVTVIQNSCQHFESLWRRFSASLHTACCSCATAGTSSAGTGGTGSPGTEAQSVGGVIHSPGDSASDCPSPAPSPRLSLVPKARPPRGAVWFYISGSGTRFSPESPWVSETPPVRPVRAPRGTAARWSGAPARRPVRERRPLWSAFWCPACTAAHRMNSWPTPRCGDIHPPSSAARPAAHSVLSGLHRQGKTNIKKININVCFLWQGGQKHTSCWLDGHFNRLPVSFSSLVPFCHHCVSAWPSPSLPHDKCLLFIGLFMSDCNLNDWPLDSFKESWTFYCEKINTCNLCRFCW